MTHFGLPDGTTACDLACDALPTGDNATADAAEMLLSANPCPTCRDVVTGDAVPVTRRGVEGWESAEDIARALYPDAQDHDPQALRRTIAEDRSASVASVLAADTRTARALRAAVEATDPVEACRKLLAKLEWKG